MTSPVNEPKVADAFRWSAAVPLTVEALQLLEELERKKKRFRRVIVRYLNEAYADDVWQDTVADVTVDLRRGKQIDKPDAYVRAICVNKAKSYLRGVYQQTDLLVSLKATGEPEMAGPASAPLELSESVTEALEACRAVLTPRELKIYLLRFYFDLDSRQVAEHLGTTGVAVRRAVSDANKKLEQAGIRIPNQRSEA